MQYGIDEIMYYGGLGIAIAAVLLGIICFLAYRYQKAKLELELMNEYGDVISMAGDRAVHTGSGEN